MPLHGVVTPLGASGTGRHGGIGSAQADSVTRSCHTEYEQRPQHGSATPILEEKFASTRDYVGLGGIEPSTSAISVQMSPATEMQSDQGVCTAIRLEISAS